MGTRAALPGIAFALLMPACDNIEHPIRDRDEDARLATGGDPNAGRDAIRRYGCLSCHTIPGLPGEANVGPPLDRVGSRIYIAGVLVNTPDNLKTWLKNPPAVDPKTAMPNVSASESDVKDIAAYLYTLR